MQKSYIESSWSKKDPSLDLKLRPSTLDEFIGQEALRERLGVFVGAAKKRGEPLGHCILSGPPGLGKTTLASIIATQMGTQLVVTSGPAIDKPGDLAGILTNLAEGDVLFIDEIHRLSRVVEEYLYPAMEDFNLDIMLDSGPSARSVQVKLNQFTLVGATTRLGLLSSPLRTRFALNCRIDYYPAKELFEIVKRSAHVLNMKIEESAADEIAKRARGTPRIANNLLRWTRDFAEMKADGKISLSVAKNALDMLSIDHLGLDELDKKILKTIIDHYEGGPVGLQTLAASLGEEAHTLSDVYEPYLIMQGLLKRTQRGREATMLAYQHLKGE
ncbi:MAG: Holliday junction branch migration DNA helicase RuvB [Chlamydiales bacterium]|nr:Holliday junction branch migration DNA helicase RuvB [Chlamydiales bacterium]